MISQIRGFPEEAVNCCDFKFLPLIKLRSNLLHDLNLFFIIDPRRRLRDLGLILLNLVLNLGQSWLVIDCHRSSCIR